MGISNAFYSVLLFILDRRVQITAVVGVAVFAAYVLTGTQPKSILDPTDNLGWIGWLATILGLMMRGWAAGILHKEQTLATTGPYALVRHPLYVGTFTSGVGFAILLNEPGFYAMIAALFVFVYIPKMRQEERKMAARFGEQWEAFTKGTFMLFPRRFPPPIFCPWQPSQWWKNKEYRAVLPTVILLAAMELLHHYPL